MSSPRCVLRPGLLDGVHVMAGAPWAAACTALGAAVAEPPADPLDETAVGARLGALDRVDALVVDAAAPFGAGGAAGLRTALGGAWNVLRAAATQRWIPGGAGGKAVLLAPQPGAGPHAEAARAALENLARTTSIEWARFGIRPVAVTPGDATADDEIATLVAFLASQAGDYFSGCRLDLGAVSSR